MNILEALKSKSLDTFQQFLKARYAIEQYTMEYCGGEKCYDISNQLKLITRCSRCSALDFYCGMCYTCIDRTRSKAPFQLQPDNSECPFYLFQNCFYLDNLTFQ